MHLPSTSGCFSYCFTLSNVNVKIEAEDWVSIECVHHDLAGV